MLAITFESRQPLMRRNPDPRSLGGRGGQLELLERVRGALEERPRVVDLLAVADDPEVDAVLVADDRDVQADAVDDHRDGEVRLHLRAGAVERGARARDVGDHEVQRRARAAEDVDRVARRERGDGGRDEGGRVGQQARRQRGVSLLGAAQQLVRALQPPARVGLVGRDRDDHHRDPVAPRAALVALAHRHRDHRDERVVAAARRARSASRARRPRRSRRRRR